MQCNAGTGIISYSWHIFRLMGFLGFTSLYFNWDQVTSARFDCIFTTPAGWTLLRRAIERPPSWISLSCCMPHSKHPAKVQALWRGNPVPWRHLTRGWCHLPNRLQGNASDPVDQAKARAEPPAPPSPSARALRASTQLPHSRVSHSEVG